MTSMFRSMFGSANANSPQRAELDQPDHDHDRDRDHDDDDDDASSVYESPDLELPGDVVERAMLGALEGRLELHLAANGTGSAELAAAPEDKQPSAKPSGKSTLGKKSRKRLAAMMSRLQATFRKQKGRPGWRARKMSLREVVGAIGQLGEQADSGADEQFCDPEVAAPAEPDRKASQGPAREKQDADKANDCLLPEEQCDIPTFLYTQNCDPSLIAETRRLLRERYAKNPDLFYDTDYARMLADDWTVSRFLLRRRKDPKQSAKLMEECGRFRKQYKMSEVQLWEFPVEFHKAGGLFKYAPDRVGNNTVYMRVRMYRRVPEISDVFKAFILCVLEEADKANNGRGTAVVFDLSGCGLQNVDLGFLSWLLSSFRNYCPKGVSYILVYNLPWILNATCKLAMTWMSASNRRALRFVHGHEIENFIAKENLPDYCGGTCPISYRQVPEGSLPATEVCDRLDMTPGQALKIRDLFKEYLDESDYDKIEERRQQQRRRIQQLEQEKRRHSPVTGVDNGLSNGLLANLADANLTSPASVELVSQATRFMA